MPICCGNVSTGSAASSAWTNVRRSTQPSSDRLRRQHRRRSCRCSSVARFLTVHCIQANAAPVWGMRTMWSASTNGDASDAEPPIPRRHRRHHARPPAAQTVQVGGQPMFPGKTIVANAVNSADHTTLVAAVKAAGLVDTLKGPGPFTVFAPVNAAFSALPAGTVDTLLKPENKPTLTKVLTYHVVPGRMDAAALMSAINAGGGKAMLKT